MDLRTWGAWTPLLHKAGSVPIKHRSGYHFTQSLPKVIPTEWNQSLLFWSALLIDGIVIPNAINWSASTNQEKFGLQYFWILPLHINWPVQVQKDKPWMSWHDAFTRSKTLYCIFLISVFVLMLTVCNLYFPWKDIPEFGWSVLLCDQRSLIHVLSSPLLDIAQSFKTPA